MLVLGAGELLLGAAEGVWLGLLGWFVLSAADAEQAAARAARPALVLFPPGIHVRPVHTPIGEDDARQRP